MFNWRSYPIIRFILPLIAGILCAIHAEMDYWGWIDVFIISVLLLISIKYLGIGKSYQWNWLHGVLANVTLFVGGILLVAWHTPSNQDDFYMHQFNQDWIIGEVETPPVEKANTYQVRIDVKAIYSGDLSEASGTILAYIRKDTAAARLDYGQLIAFKPVLEEIDGPRNPGQFNYKRYMRFQGITERCYLTPELWLDLGINDGSALMQMAHSLRRKFLKILSKSGVSESQMPIASALILGERESLDEETKKAYSTAGAMHVLAVSGLHVGIIYIVLNFALRFLDRTRRSKVMKAILLLSVLWLYALITGLSPSVLRATTMFSFMVVAGALNRQTNIYNTIAASAFLLLIINPFLIMQVGFQLSYLAVLGIIYFQPKIYGWFYFRHKASDYLWKITSVSIAAQIATFPLGLFYFHQFPVYFFVSNVVVIPCAAIILVLGLLTILTGFSDIISGWFGSILNYVILFLNGAVNWIEALPLSLIEGISISAIGCWLLYLTIGALITAIEQRRLRYLTISMVFLLMLFATDLYEDMMHSNSSQISIYSTNGHFAMDCIQGNEHVFVAAPDYYQDRRQLSFHVKNHWSQLDLAEEKFVPLRDTASIVNLNFDKIGDLICFRGKTVGILSPDTRWKPSFRPDILYVDDFWLYFEDTVRFKGSQLVFSENVRSWQLEQLAITDYHWLGDRAFVLDMSANR